MAMAIEAKKDQQRLKLMHASSWPLPVGARTAVTSMRAERPQRGAGGTLGLRHVLNRTRSTFSEARGTQVERGRVFCMPFPTFQGSRILILILIRSNNFTAFFNFTEIRFLFRLTSCGCSDTVSTVGH